MTSSHETTEAPRCSLKTELSKVSKPPRFVLSSKLAIEPVVEELEKRIGGAPLELRPSRDFLKESEDLLIVGQGDISGLSRRQRWAVPYFLWNSEREWWKNTVLIDDLLAWADREGNAAPGRLWGHYLLNMNPESVATQRLAHWLDARCDKLAPALRDFSKNCDLFKPEQAIAKFAGSLLAGPFLIDEIIDLRVDREKLLKSACLLSVFKTLGQRLRDYQHSSVVPQTLKHLLADLRENPIHKMQGHAGLGQAAQTSLVEGLVIWADRQGDAAVIPTLDFLHILIGDPRLYGARWTEIDTGVRQTVERWLTDITLETFFVVFRSQQTANPKMVAERELFWRGYRRKISRAWLITGINGRAIAERLLGKSFGQFGSSAGADHLGLMMQMGSYVILEMNQNGRTLFWPMSDAAMPDFYQAEYKRGALIDLCRQATLASRDGGRFHMIHSNPPGQKMYWQSKYEDKISRVIGVSR